MNDRPADADASDAHTLDLGSFGFDLAEDAWLERVRRSESQQHLGTIGDYELIEEVSRGGQGVVFRGRQPNTNREIAIKRLIAGSFATKSVRARFDREIAAAASLNHPNIVTVYGTDVIDGQPLLAMEWIDGVPIDRWALGDEALPGDLPEILRLFIKVCNAVHHAHLHGIIHRDLKPRNILVDQAGEPHVLDFGLAKLTGGDDSGQAHLTYTRDFLGTPAYASPEQTRSDHSAVDARSDVYALGVILYQMLTASMPYPISGDLHAVLSAIQEVEPQRPSARVRGLNREIDAIVLKALAKEQSQRYQSVNALSTDISRLLAGETVLAHVPSTAYQLRKLMRRHRLAFALGTSIFVLALAFGIVATVLASRLYAEQKRATRAGEQARDARETAVEIDQFVRGMLASVDPENEGVDVTVRQVLDSAAKRVETELADRPAVELGVRSTIGNTYKSLGLYPQALPHLRRALALSNEAAGADEATRAACMGRLADLLNRMGQYEEAESLARESLRIRRGAFGEQHEAAAAAMNSLALILYATGQYDQAETLYRGSLDIRRAFSDRDTVEIAGNLSDLAGSLYAKGDFAGAERLLRDAVELTREFRGPRDPSLPNVLNNLAGIRMMRGDYAGAEPLFREVLAQYADIFGDEHPSIATTLNNLAEVLRRQGRLAESEKVQRRCLAMRRKLLGDEHASVARSMNNLALVLVGLGRLDEGAALHRQTLALRRRILGDDHPDLATSLNNLAFTLRKLGQLDESESLARDAVALRQKRLGDNHPLVATSLSILSMTVASRGRTAEAETIARRVVDIRRAALDGNHPDLGTALSELGGLVLARESFEEAQPILHEALGIERGSLPSDSVRVARTSVRLGVCLTGLGRFDEAETRLTEGYRVLRTQRGDDHADTQDAVARLVAHYVTRDDAEQAAKYRSMLRSKPD